MKNISIFASYLIQIIDNMKTIGFANVYYTLWDITSEVCKYQAPDGKIYPSYTIVHYAYIQNISKDLEKVKSLYPDVEIDLELKGTKSYSIEKKEIDLSPEILKFGKYAGFNVNELVKIDFKYVLYMIENYGARDSWKIAKKTPEYIEYLNEKQNSLNKQIEALQPLTSGKYKFIVEMNPNKDGNVYISISDFHEVRLHFNDIKPYSYNGYEYFLPIFKDGKSKRIKSKELEYTLEIISTEIDKEKGTCYQEANIIN